MIIDFHTHLALQQPAGSGTQLVSTSPDNFDPEPGVLYSIGIHPWDTALVTDAHLRLLELLAWHPQVVAIGETGLDTLKGAHLDRQMEIFKFHVTIAEQVAKPLVIHAVHTSQQVIQAWKESRQLVPWAIHGMRGNENVARPFIDAGFYLSFGVRFNPKTVGITPLNRLLIETDDAPVSIQTVAAQVAETLGLSQQEIIDLATQNATSILMRKF